MPTGDERLLLLIQGLSDALRIRVCKSGGSNRERMLLEEAARLLAEADESLTVAVTPIESNTAMFVLSR